MSVVQLIKAGDKVGASEATLLNMVKKKRKKEKKEEENFITC